MHSSPVFLLHFIWNLNAKIEEQMATTMPLNNVRTKAALTTNAETNH